MVGLLVIPREMERVPAAWEIGGEGGGLAALVGVKGIWENPEEDETGGLAAVARRMRQLSSNLGLDYIYTLSGLG